MPRTKASGPSHDWDALFERAAPQAGYFTLADALEAGFSPPLLHYHSGSRVERSGSRVERMGRGIYRLRHFPLHPDDELVPLWLWADKAGTFSQETALLLHGLSDALPARHHLTVPAAWRTRRLRVPPGMVLHFGDLMEGDVAWHGPVPVTSPSRTLQDCAAAHVQPDVLEAATRQAIARGLVGPAELDGTPTRGATP